MKFMDYILDIWQSQLLYIKVTVIAFVVCIFAAIFFLIVKKPRKNKKQTPVKKPLSKDRLYSYDSMDGNDFQEFCAEILRQLGYKNIETKKSRDYGADILAEKDDVTYAIQCKRYSDNVGNDAIQEAHTAKDFYKCHVSVVITNQYFTKSAIETAAATRTILWNRTKLNEFIYKTGMKVNELVKLSKSNNKKVDAVKNPETDKRK